MGKSHGQVLAHLSCRREEVLWALGKVAYLLPRLHGAADTGGLDLWTRRPSGEEDAMAGEKEERVEGGREREPRPRFA